MTSSLYLVGNREIRQMLGDISRQRVYQLTSRPDFPSPVASLSQGKVWRGEDVEAWMEHKRRPRFPTPLDPSQPDDPTAPEIPRVPGDWAGAAARPGFTAPAPRPYDRSTLIPCCLHALEHRTS
ncbi:helix-turn-helix transcriptional regulator [Actinoplanes derwentensis]|uniref:Prophage CP4-57 regulatory protein (AlpA) n=1 Tax=Actinoplanes derwentensis TaxID=113562 RepID=A0A1H1YVT6_9ACTN|nr:hypothetical protein [Actinoplanes derwentensis]GID81297.1 hypothetical protein Ade03nite_02210 [Actinoplanes derwentensis]SDT25096.1 hypothetical protein SAMN04489716_3005 [Actinoplanes derwentensis]